MLAEVIPLSLYIHLPWCVRKCPYCDFNSHHKPAEGLPEMAYVKALLEDVEHDLPKIWGRRIHSIFIGGGTPSLFSGEAFEELFNGLRARLNFKPGIEITLEANPGTVERQFFQAYHEIGINRLSLGVQSFEAEKLKALGRIHSTEEALSALGVARDAGFENINIDLMFGLPQQSLEEALLDLQTALAQQTPHLSWYQLTLEPNTLFYKQPPILPNEDHLWEIQQAGQALLKEQGFINYEVSAYSKPGKNCQHNRNYWEFGDYLGIGAGAHSKITDMAQQSIKRFWKHKQPKQYLNSQANFIGGESTVLPTALPFEFMLNALRLQEPISAALFAARTGLAWSELTPTLEQAAAKQLLSFDEQQLIVTDLGKQFLNDLMALFLEA